MVRSLRKPVRFSLEQLEQRALLAADVFISEFSASNAEVLVDEDGDSPDWIEIYNAGPDDVDLGGWHLTDDATLLRKWSFPSQTLAAGNFLVVHASDKDRAVAGSPLHTNFKLTTDGEYLALTQAVDASTTNIVSDFAPSYPFQFTDISYGVGQTVSESQLTTPSSAAKVFFPTSNALGSSWQTTSFNDASWANATAGVGYQLKVPGFTVKDAKSTGVINNVDLAIDTLDGINQQSETTVVTDVVNFVDTGGSGNFAGDAAFPNNTGGDDNDFAIRATGTITIPASGTWTFGINSDDGARLLIGGNEVIDDDTLHAPRDTFGSTTLSAGDHEIELIFFERGGGAEVELFAAQGSFGSFNSQFKLIGDVANGGLEVNTSPSGTTGGFSSLFETDVQSQMLNQSSDVFLRVPFNVSNPASLDSLTLRMNYDDGFVAYLNGTEVARRNAPAGVVPGNSSATTDRPRSEAAFVESISITPFLSSLNSGANVLAIHGLNEAINADEFLISAELTEISAISGDLFYFNSPSPRDFNPSTGVEGFLTNEITYSQPHGFYDSSFPLTMTAATAGTTIRYTTDGSEPTATNGTVYSSPVTISETTTIRARAFKTGLDPSFVETRTFLFLDDIVDQRRSTTIAAGFPSSNVNGQVLDYGMDPDIVNSATWSSQMEAALTQIPSMSVVMDIDDFAGSDGIYVNAGGHGKSWERPASLELINPDGSDGFTVNAGIRIRGGFSRSGNNPKHAFRLFFRDEYGDAKLEYPLFGDEGTDEYDKLDLRTAQNYSWSFGGDGRNSFMRDIFSRDVQGALENPYTRGRFYHLYINGQYWGLFQSEERPEANFARDYLGGKSSHYDVVKSAGSSGGYENEATDGNLDAYRRLADFFYQTNGIGDANQADYMQAQGFNLDGSVNPDYERLLDVDNLIDYMLITYYTSDADGPGSEFTRPRVNNYFTVYNREDPDGFKFFEHDSEHSLDTGNAAGANYNMVEPFLGDSGLQFRYFNPHWMHEQLAQSNTEYRTRFMDRVTEQLFNDGVLTAENAQSIIETRAAQIDDAIIAESARWGDAKRTTPYTKTDWQNAVGRIQDFIADRGPIVLDQLRNVGWYPDENPPQFLVNSSPQHGGSVNSNDELAIATSTTFSYNQTLVAKGSTWKYLDNGSNQGTAWRSSSFNDSSWASGAAELGYGDGDEATEVDFGSNSNDKHVTTYYRRTFNVSDTESLDGLKVQLRRDDGAVVYLNGTEVARSNMPSGVVNFETSAAGVAGGGDETTFFEFEIDADLLVAGSNVLAVEIHQVVAGGGTVTSSDTSFDLALLGGSVSVNNSGQIYYTTDGSDPRLPGGNINPAAILFNPATGFSLSGNALVIARTLNAGQWGTALKANFDVATVNDDMPVAVADTINATEDTVASANVGSNDTLSNDGGNVFALATNATNGVATVAANGNVTYTPNANFNGADSFQYRLTDADGDASVATVTVNVASVNDLPVAVNDSASGTEDTQLNGNVSGNDTLSGDGGNTFSLATGPANGAATVSSSGSFVYTPNANFNGSDSFTYQLSDANGDSVTATVSISVASVDDVPVVVNDLANATEDTAFSGNVATNDTLSGDGGNVFSVLANPSNGSVSMNASGQFTYTPNVNFNGNDSFTYQLTDADGDSRTGTVSIVVAGVNDLPVPANDSFNATEDVALSGNVLANDVLSSDGGNVAAIATNPSNGSVTMNAAGLFSYTPNANFNGNDSFTYTLTDVDGDNPTATVSITVTSVDDLPSVTNDLAIVAEDATVNGSVATNDTLSGDGGNVFSIVTNPTSGSVSLNSSGQFSYTPNANFNGNDSFTYQLTDGDGDSETGVVGITVTSVDDLPVSANDGFTATEDLPLNGNVAANDTLSGDGGNVVSVATNPSNGTVSMAASGQFTYTPAANFNGSDSFTYNLTDADGDVSTSTVSITVNDAADVPVAGNDTFSATEDVVFTGNVSSNDSLSGDGGNTFSLSSGPANGSVSVNSNGTFTYTPNADFNGSDSFTYTLSDADADSSSATVTINVASVNDLPTVVNDLLSTNENTSAAGDVSANDTLSADGGNVFSVSMNPSNGSVTMNANGTFTYVPNANYSGSDSFSYVLTDVDGDERTGVVSVTVIKDTTSIPGDLNGDSELSAADIDILLAGVGSGSTEQRFDLNDDGEVTQEDIDYMVETIFRTKAGDADLDGDVDFADFLTLSANFGASDTSWSQGNFNADGETSFTDFLLLSSNFGWKRDEG